MKNFFVVSIFLLFSANVGATMWDNKHFIKYTSNAIANTALISCCAWNACYAYHGNNQEKEGSVAVPASMALAAAYIGLEKYRISQQNNPNANILKDSINTCADTILLFTSLSGIANYEAPEAAAFYAAIYLCKYAYFNRPRTQEERDTTQKQKHFRAKK